MRKMGTTQPIRKKTEIEALKNYFLDKNEIRNYVLVVMGLNMPLRISDILSIKWKDVYNEQQGRYLKYLQITEKKTQKRNYMTLNTHVIKALQLLMETQKICTFNRYIFSGNSLGDRPISRVTAYLIIHNAAEYLGIPNIGCHSLRKTFGYHAWKQGVHLALIMSIYNHSSISITKRYLGIEQEDKDNVFQLINL